MVWQAGDIVLCKTGQEWGFLSPLVKWLAGDWGHAMIYVFSRGTTPFFVEARPKKGVSLITARPYNGKRLCVYRLDLGVPTGIPSRAAALALTKSDNPDTLYGLCDILVFAIPKLVARKLGLRVRPWQPDRFTICSELVWECYKEAGFNFDTRGIPLPGDFVSSRYLRKVDEGSLWVP